MKTAVAVLAVSAAYLAVADELPQVQEIADEVAAAQVDPMTGKVWDSTATEWVTLEEYRASIAKRGTVFIQQVPFVAPSITNGMQVLADREKAVRAHWERVLYMQDALASPLSLR